MSLSARGPRLRDTLGRVMKDVSPVSVHWDQPALKNAETPSACCSEGSPALREPALTRGTGRRG